MQAFTEATGLRFTSGRELGFLVRELKTPVRQGSRAIARAFASRKWVNLVDQLIATIFVTWITSSADAIAKLI